MASRITGYLRNNVLGLVALFIALGAGAYAAGLPKNSVKSKQIKAGAVKTDELADNAVTSPKVADGSLLGEDFAAGELPQGPPGTPATRLWANVNSDGTILKSSSSAITATFVADLTDYRVDFGQDISNCIATATIADLANATVPSAGQVLLTKTADPETVYVDTRTSAGADSAGARPFAIAVFC